MFGEKNFLFGPWGRLVWRGAFKLERNCDLSSQSYNSRATTGRGEGVGCGLDLKYALIVAAAVSEVEFFYDMRHEEEVCNATT